MSNTGLPEGSSFSMTEEMEQRFFEELKEKGWPQGEELTAILQKYWDEYNATYTEEERQAHEDHWEILEKGFSMPAEMNATYLELYAEAETKEEKIKVIKAMKKATQKWSASMVVVETDR